ncbi:ABC transporter permease [Spiroplasma taiwanense]|uniref:Efflux ABC transporter, permease protein n=1 Tax=Spiroplasma taiwanense CT-1 TaxID=1276220 RepID=S5MD34_9MOLU|nr:ABC transporter permease [Spiroplasma taiwanense]AGR41618.1 efflux ABC transporter, permease protein [Spiroplasma taiwanense CT-1]
MKKINAFLLTKQGVKGIFKYKIQFVLIVILGFFASLILSITFSINDRLEYEYNRTMGNTAKFDYIETQTLESSNQSESKEFTPFVDFISNQFLQFDDKSIAYNFNISSFENNENYKSTFLTKAFESDNFKKIFQKLISSDFTKSWFDFNYDESKPIYFNAYGMDETMSNRDKTNFWYRFDSLNKYNDYEYKSPYLVYTSTKNGLNGFANFVQETIKLIKNQLEISEFNDNSLISQFINKKIQSGFTKETILKELDVYINYSIVSIIAQLNKMMHDYVQYWMDQAILQKINWEDYFTTNSGLSKSNINNASVIYCWLFGKKLDINDNVNENFIVNENNKEWDQKVNSSNLQTANILKNGDNIYENGARGSLIQITYENDLVKANDSGAALTLLKEEGNIANTLRYKKAFKDKSNYLNENASIPTSYLYRTNLLSFVTNLDVYSRLELNLPDNNQEKQYRFVLMDNQTKSNLTIYQGQNTRTLNEILINPQYAKQNKIKLGENIKVGDFDLTVSGYAADPYTNFPLADLSVPFPNNKKGAIIFISPEALELVIKTADAKISTTNLYTIFTGKNKTDVKKDISLYNSLSFSYKDKIYDDLNNIKSEGTLTIDYGTKLVSYNEHFFSWNWDLTPIVLKTFSIILYSTCSIILLICLITIIISVRKTINFNSPEIGILKALGAKNSQISFGYISYGLILLLIVIPISWFLGGFLQDPFSSLFISYMGGAYKQVTFNGYSLAILLFTFGITVILVSYFTAFYLINKPVLKIIEKKEVVKRIVWLDNLKTKITRRTKFTVRFSIELATSTMKPTLIASITILITSLLISSSMAIPGMVSKAVTSYYKNVKYSNSIKNIEPIGNAPMAKTALSPWNGADYYQNYLININNEFDGINYLSNSVTNTTSISDFSMFPKLVLNQDPNKQIKSEWLFDFITNSSNQLNTEENSALLSVIFSIFGSGLAQSLGKGISIAEIQRIIEWMAHDYRRNQSNNMESFKKDVKNITGLLTEGLPQVMDQLFPLVESEGNINGSWKENIINIILSQAPTYVKNFLDKSENRFNQYNFGWTYSNYIPGKDDFYTEADFNTINGKDSKILGLLSNQKAYKFEKNGDEIFIGNEQIEQLKKVINEGNNSSISSIKTNTGFELYNNGVLNIPVNLNEQAKLNLKQSGKKIEVNDFQSTRLVLSSDKKSIPNGAWIYDDSDWKTLKNENLNKFLNPFNMDISKFTFAKIFDKSNYDYDYDWNGTSNSLKLTNNSYGFINVDYDNENNLKTEIRSYYQYENLLLFVPTKYEKDFSSLFKMGSNNDNSKWHGKTNSAPDEVINAWGANKTDEFIWIRPYSLRFDSTFKPVETNFSGGELDYLLNHYNSFYKMNFLQLSPAIIDKYTDMNWKEKGIKQINLVPISKLDVFGKNLIIADQRLINLLHGFSDDIYIPFNYIFEKEQKSSYLLNNNEIQTYEYNTPEDLIATENEKNWIWGNEAQKTYKPLQWNNGIYSQEKEPLFLTTQASFSKSVRVGEYSLNGNSQYYDGLEMEKVEFLTEQKSLINQITSLVLTIGITFIVVIIIIATLSMIIITDLYANQYKRFMIVMKSLGYSNWKIIKYSFGFLTFLATICLALGILTSFGLVWLTTTFVQSNLISIPIGLTWWSPLASSILIITSYISSILITTRKIRTESPITLMG